MPKVGSGAIAIGVVGGSLGISTVETTFTSSVSAYIDNAAVTTTNGGNIKISASSQDTATTLGVATSLALTLGGAGAGATITVNVSPNVEAYAGSGASLSAAGDIDIAATANNSSRRRPSASPGVWSPWARAPTRQPQMVRSRRAWIAPSPRRPT